MTSRNFLSFNALICFGFAVLLVFIPQIFLPYFIQKATVISEFGLFLAKAYGCLIFAEGLCFWMGRTAKNGTELFKVVLWFSLMSNATTAIIYLIGYLKGEANHLIIPIILFVSALAISALYLLFYKTSDLK